jgi:hypothetical protein
MAWPLEGTSSLGILWLPVAVLNLAAMYKIITKAGYSGWWILLPIAPLVSLMVGSVATASAARTGSLSHLLHTLAGWYVITVLLVFIDWIFLSYLRLFRVARSRAVEGPVPPAPRGGPEPLWHEASNATPPTTGPEPPVGRRS